MQSSAVEDLLKKTLKITSVNGGSWIHSATLVTVDTLVWFLVGGMNCERSRFVSNLTQ